MEILLVISGLALLFFFLALRSGEYLIYRPDSAVSDFTVTFWPNIHYIRRSIFEHGQLPLWRWSIFSGAPFDSDPQSGLWYPPNAIFLLLPINWGFNLLFWAHSVGAGLGMWLWSKSTGTSDQGAFISALAYAFAPRAFAHLGFGHLGLFYAGAYIPWIMWGARGVGEGRRHFSGVVGLALGLQILSHLQLAVYTSGLALGYILILRLNEQRRPSPRLLASEALWAGCGFILAGAVAAIQLVPLLRFLPLSARAQMGAGGEIVSALPPGYLLGLFLPDYTGFADFMVYVGIPVLALIIVAMRLRAARIWLSVAGFLLAYALITGFEPFGAWMARMPVLGWLRAPARIWFLIGAVIVLIAGWGYDQISRKKSNVGLAASRLFVFALLIFVMLLLVGWRLMFGEVPGNLLHFGLAVTATALLLLSWIEGWLGRRLFFTLCVCFLMIDLWVMDLTLVEGRSPEQVFADGDLAAAVADRIGDEPWRIYSPSYSLPRQISARFALETVDGVDPLYLAIYDEFLQLASGVEREAYSGVVPAMEGGAPVEVVNQGARPDPRLLGLLNAKYLLSEFPIGSPELRLREVVGSTYVYENSQALPRAFLVNRTIPAQPAQDALRSLQLHDVSKVAVVEDGPRLDGPEFEWRVGWVERTPNHLSLRVETQSHSLLVLSQIWYFDWEARVDGDVAEIHRTDGMLMGIELEPGSHLVSLRYRPATLLWGVLLSLAGLGMAITLIAVNEHGAKGAL